MSRCLPLAVALAVVLVHPPAAAQPPDAGAPADSRQQLLAELAGVLRREPGHVGAVYVSARTAAALGDQAQALRWLDRLEALRWGDQLEAEDFGTFARTAGFRERAARHARASPPLGTPAGQVELDCQDLLPEGTAWDARRAELLVSSGRQRKVVAVAPDGGCRDVVPAGAGGLLAVLGMQVDPATDSLWVAHTAAPFMVGWTEDQAGRAALSRLDLASGTVAATHPLPGRGLLNDVALAADGGVYVTESQGGTVYLLAPGAEGLRAILPAGTLDGPNGLVALDDGALLVGDFHGLWRVDAPAGASPTLTRLGGPAGMYLGGFDGLARAGGRVVGIQNLVGRARVWALELDRGATRVTRAVLLLRAHPDLRNPTTGAVAGDRYRFVADPRLQESLPDGGLGPVPAGRRGHRVLELRLPRP